MQVLRENTETFLSIPNIRDVAAAFFKALSLLL